VVGDEATHGPQDPWGVVAELDHAGAMTPARDDQHALVGHPGAARCINRACSRNGWSSAATTNSTGTRRRAIAPWASTPPNPEAPDRLTTAATGGRIRVAADSTAVPPIDEPTSTTRSTPRRRSWAVAATTSLSTRPSGPGWESPKPAKSKTSTR
jgi:hypothetical protein